MPQTITPFLWFDHDAQAAAKFYVSLFKSVGKGAKIISSSNGSTTFRLDGHDYIAFNGGPTFALNAAFSMFVQVKTQAEVNRFYDKLVANGGKPSRCGWLVDRFGLSWQIIPEVLPKLLYNKDANVAQAAMEAMLKMERIEIKDLEAAVAAVMPSNPSKKPKKRTR